jgi:hypothetical protein
MERTSGFTDCLDIKKLPYEVIVADEQDNSGRLEEKLQKYLMIRKRAHGLCRQ